MANALFTIGRATGLRAQRLNYDGDSLSIVGHVLPSSDSAQAVLATRQQLRGLLDNPDEQVFPVTCSVDPTIDGYYRVRGASVDDTSVMLGSKGRFGVQLERLGTGYTNVVQECAGVALDRTNTLGIGAGIEGIWSIPSAALTDVLSDNADPVTRTTDTGAVIGRFFNQTIGNTALSFVCPPADHYDGSARIESKLGGSTYYEMVGRQVPLTPTNWRLTNGLLRIQNSATSGMLCDLYAYNGSSWSTTPFAIRFTARQDAVVDPGDKAFSNVAVLAVTVLRNSPEVCTVRLLVNFQTITGTNAARYANITQQVDISLRRGDCIATVNILPGVGWFSATLGDNAAAASTGLTGSIRNDTAVNGNRFVTGGTSGGGSTSLWTQTTSRSSARGLNFIGVEILGSSATGRNTAQEITNQWFTPFVERQRVVLA